MNKIGFIDYYLDEFHANHFPAWITGSKLADQFEVAYAYAEKDKAGGLTSEAWCRKFNIEHIDSLEDIVEKSDCLVVLAPDETHSHERLSAPGLKAGKPVFLDKVLADNLESGKRICELADKHNTPMYSSSALRFAKEYEQIPEEKRGGEEIDFISLMGSGSFEVHIVHQIEMLVALCGTGAKRMMNIGTEITPIIKVEFEDKLAHLTIMGKNRYAAALSYKDNSALFLPECTEFFPRSIEAMLDFFLTKQPPCTHKDNLNVIAAHTAAHTARKKQGTWIDIVD